MAGVSRLCSALAGTTLRATHLEFALFLGDRLASIGLLATLGETEIDLHATLAKANFERHEGEALALHAFLQAANLLGVQQELSWANGLV